jgi:hypothetical protein
MLLIDADGSDYPNLALMQLSAYFKKQGHTVSFGASDHNPDEVYISCVFTKNREKAILASTWYPNAEIHFGGTGFNLTSKIPSAAQHLKPDYSLYPQVDYSLGFTSRGCIRKCPWCVVPQKEGWIREHSPLDEFLEPTFNKVNLLDNNFLASPKCNDKLEQLIDIRKKTSFSQGLDVRLVTPENAELLSQVWYYDQSFKYRRLYLAWDFSEVEPHVLKGIETLLDAGIKPGHLMFYVLIGYNTTYEQDMHRVQTLIDLGVKPYVMPYNEMRGTYHHHLRRWVNRRFYMVVPWTDYDKGDSQKIIRRLEGLDNSIPLEKFT